MPSDRDAGEPLGVVDTLLMPLRLPGRVVADIETLTHAAVSLQRNAEQRLGSIDDRAGELIEGLRDLHGSVGEIRGTVDTLEQERLPAFLDALGKLQESIDRIEVRIEKLESLEVTIEGQMEAVREDLNTRMLAVEHEVRSIRPAMDKMATDVAKVDQLLPDPSDGPLTRLKDTLTSSS